MEAIAAELLTALASGTAGAAGHQAWEALRALVRRNPGPEAEPDPTPGTGENEVTALARETDSEHRARELARVLEARARQDPDFARALDSWRRTAERAAAPVTGPGDVHQEISGGTQGTVIMARDIQGSLHIE
ncbi:hypothetical protein PV416_48840 [Streptomyces ipomoeae]|uniref:hypothetical protein n=1 Tax=Streptomyces ipomoeae TaxID=103232 RepID=UPI0029AB5BE9|nr:hypothetical protein [Streptomyces ipomoeae]MDX2828750.1 hypothetical protein [Streptomyces ipomoeae]MDX2881228.1 hypothetical protein [Streptomyces ipomoeae]